MLQYFPNITGSLQVTGSVSVSGSITATGGIIVSGSIASASYSSNSELLDNLDSTAFVFTSSFNTYSSSMSTRTTTLENASASLNTASGSFSGRVTTIESKYATTGSNIFTGAQTVCANITSTGTIIAQTLNVQQVTSSIVYSSGSNTFGCSLSNTQQFTGSVTITGSLGVSGNTCVGGTITGTTVYGSTLVCSAMVCSPQSAFTYTGTTGNAVRINGDNLTTGTALSIVANNGSPSHTGNVVEICNAFNAGAAAKLLCLYQGDDGDGIYVNMARGGVGLTIDGVGSGYSAIFNNGNVGIGCTAPSQKLDIGSGHIKLSDGYGLFYGTQTQVYASEASKYVRFDIAGTSGVMFLTGSGNVGIGTTTPQNKLSVSDSTSNYISVDRTSNNYRLLLGAETFQTAIYSRDAVTPATGVDLRFVVGTTEAMRISGSNANVGIGIASPSFRLDTMCYTVGQNITVANFASCNYNCGCRTYIQIGTQYGDGSSRIGNISTTGNSSDIVFEPHSNTSGVWCERMRLTSCGNVTICTIDNQGGLTVTSAQDNTTVRVGTTATGGQEWRIQSTGGTSGLGQGKLFFKVGTTEAGCNIPLVLTTDNGANGARVGIGIVSPEARLHIDSNNASPSTIQILRLQTTRATNNCYGIELRDSSNEVNAAIYSVQEGSNNRGSLVIGTNNGTGGNGLGSTTPQLRIFGSGTTCFSGTVCAPGFTLTPEIISNSGTAFFANWGGIKFYCGNLINNGCFGATGGTYSPMFVYISSFDGVSGRASALFMTINPAANAGTVLISQGGSYAYCSSFGAANTISFAFDGSTRGPRIVNKTGVAQDIYMYVFGGA